jgi:hypothetical protein
MTMTSKAENPSQTAFFASFFPYFSFSISVARKVEAYKLFPRVAVKPMISIVLVTWILANIVDMATQANKPDFPKNLYIIISIAKLATTKPRPKNSLNKLFPP